MDDQVQVRRVLSIAQPAGGYRFDVELHCAGRSLRVLVSAAELLDFDRFQAAALEQTGHLVMAPCEPGREGPEAYRRHRRAWCNELQAATWIHPHGASSGGAIIQHKSTGAVPKPKSSQLRDESNYRHG